MKEKIKEILYYFLLPKFRIWKPVLYLLAIQLFFIFGLVSYPNLYEKNLHKVSGVLNKVDYYVREKGFTLHKTFNFQMEGDSILYSQNWYYFNYPAFIRKFFYRGVTLEEKDIQTGDKIEFYVDKSPSLYPYKIQHWYDKRKDKNMTTIVYTTERVLLCYGIELNGVTLTDYRKRGFYSKHLLSDEKFFILTLLFVVSIFLLHFYAALFTYKKYLKTKQEIEESTPPNTIKL